MKDVFSKSVTILCIIGLIVIVILAIFAKSQGSFTELYFNEHTELPGLIDYATPFIASQEGPFLIVPNVSAGWEKLNGKANSMISSESLNFADLNKSYNVSFTVVSYEAKRTKYSYNVSSGLLNQTGEFELEPKENITINLTLIPTKTEWKLNNTVSENWHDILDITDNSWLAGGGAESRFRTIEDATNFKDFPISSNVDWYGEILQTKLSFDELKKEPFIRKYEYTIIDDAVKTHTDSEIVLSVALDKIILDSNRIEISYIPVIQKFEVNLTKNPDISSAAEHQEIHLWYQIRPIGVEKNK